MKKHEHLENGGRPGPIESAYGKTVHGNYKKNLAGIPNPDFGQRLVALRKAMKPRPGTFNPGGGPTKSRSLCGRWTPA